MFDWRGDCAPASDEFGSQSIEWGRETVAGKVQRQGRTVAIHHQHTQHQAEQAQPLFLTTGRDGQGLRRWRQEWRQGQGRRAEEAGHSLGACGSAGEVFAAERFSSSECNRTSGPAAPRRRTHTHAPALKDARTRTRTHYCTVLAALTPSPITVPLRFASECTGQSAPAY